MENRKTTLLIGLAVVTFIVGSGCVRRTATFTTVPQGARVFLNDEEIGRTPATVEFTWYGDYDLIYRLEGYQTVKTHIRIDPPLYQLFPIDFFAEVLWPGELHDHHDIPAQELAELELPDEAELVQRAVEFRDQALYQNPSDTEQAQR